MDIKAILNAGWNMVKGMFGSRTGQVALGIVVMLVIFVVGFFRINVWKFPIISKLFPKGKRRYRPRRVGRYTRRRTYRRKR